MPCSNEKYRSYKGEKGTTADNELNREFKAEKPNQKWVTDVTEFRLFGQKLYLSPILDLYSGDIVTYTLSDSPKLLMVTTMLEQSFAKIPDNTSNRRIKARLRGLPPAAHRQQALSAA